MERLFFPDLMLLLANSRERLYNESMKIAAIIAEYNPFHNGHAEQIRLLKETFGYDYVIAIMSPEFVQRGFAALSDRYVRARAALLGGVDAVFALPVCLATAAAPDFALGGVGIADGLGCVDALCFGCETPDETLLTWVAEILHAEPSHYRRVLKESLSQGLSFPAARERALLIMLCETGSFPDPIQAAPGAAAQTADLSALLSAPNNILALEYIRALKKLGSDIRPLPIRREGCGYHDLTLPESAPVSAAAIRKQVEALRSGETAHNALQICETLSPFMPAAGAEVIAGAIASGRCPDSGRYDLLVHYALLTCAAPALANIQDMGSSLAARILNRLDTYQTAASFAEQLHGKNLTCSRVCRALLHTMLGLPQTMPDRLLGKGGRPDHLYTQLVGFRKEAAPLLSLIKKSSRIPIITRPASGRQLIVGPALDSFLLDMHAQAVFDLLCENTKDRSPWQRSPLSGI